MGFEFLIDSAQRLTVSISRFPPSSRGEKRGLNLDISSKSVIGKQQHRESSLGVL